MARKSIHRDWLGQALAGVVLGFVLAIAASGLFARFGPLGITPHAGKAMFNMWIVAPVWGLILCFSPLFRSALRAWALLGVAALAACGLLFAATGPVS